MICPGGLSASLSWCPTNSPAGVAGGALHAERLHSARTLKKTWEKEVGSCVPASYFSDQESSLPLQGIMSATVSHPDKRALASKGGSCSDLDWVLHLPALQSPAHCGHFSIPFGNRPKGMLSLSSPHGSCVHSPPAQRPWLSCSLPRPLLSLKAWDCFALGTN